jgi:hypothetical protein
MNFIDEWNALPEMPIPVGEKQLLAVGKWRTKNNDGTPIIIEVTDKQADGKYRIIGRKQ